ncbi:hypothetical protein DO97_02030 [Neosynechococcus sphagnicola sy1]|uniref:ChrR-like cupin domain-containing protein n=1 Tax=Neosynechococcus sphagnicola sy1 TaxID=1497020 RepID=A0A098TMP1_9CYAN|nr:cupin domain-containing protein [Neosynechococcus sphagnicola]KGF73132.1 hypothetical protein DO97_02030 [Neosynechococcus sphagnicola sy1]
MENRDALSELAALHALNLLNDTEAGELAVVMATVPDLATELAAYQRTVAALAYSAPPIPLAPDLKGRLWQRIAADSVEQPTFLGDLIQQSTQVLWEPHPFTGVRMGKLSENLQKREISVFLRAMPGVVFPRHRHGSDEEIVVLEGDLVLDGVVYYPGDRISSQSGSIHQPITQAGCLVFVRTSLDNEYFMVSSAASPPS